MDIYIYLQYSFIIYTYIDITHRYIFICLYIYLMNFGFKGKSQERTGCKISTLTPFPLMISGKRFQLEETVHFCW